jgi:hypothetical protein
MVNPMRVIASVAKSFARRTWVSAEVDYQTGVNNSSVQLVPTVNARLGFRWQAKETLGMGIGFFTDRSNAENAQGLGDEKVDYYGMTAGVTLSTPVSLARRTSPGALVFSTTLACRYALGFGQAGTVNVDAVNSNVTSGTTSVVYQEIVPYIGAGLLL